MTPVDELPPLILRLRGARRSRWEPPRFACRHLRCRHPAVVRPAEPRAAVHRAAGPGGEDPDRPGAGRSAFDPHPALLASISVLDLGTRCGDLDLVGTAAGLEGYDEVAARSIGMLVGGVEVRVASLDDIIRSKEAADRPKDHAALPYLHALRDEIEKGGGDPHSQS